MSIIASYTVPNTPITITILHRPEVVRAPFEVVRETNGAPFSCGPSHLSNGCRTEAEARESANQSWVHYLKCRDAQRPSDPWPDDK
jgi:hypothetical protein